MRFTRRQRDLKTYFVGHCCIRFIDVYRHWRTEEGDTPWMTGPEVQIQDNKDGHDPQKSGWLYQLYKPEGDATKPAGEWNHYRVACNNGTIKLSVNGKEVSGGSECTPRKGYICLESEGTECHFRNIRIQEITPSRPPSAVRAGSGYPSWRWPSWAWPWWCWWGSSAIRRPTLATCW